MPHHEIDHRPRTVWTICTPRNHSTQKKKKTAAKKENKLIIEQASDRTLYYFHNFTHPCLNLLERGWGRGRDRWIWWLGIIAGTEERSECVCYAWRCCYAVCWVCVGDTGCCFVRVMMAFFFLLLLLWIDENEVGVWVKRRMRGRWIGDNLEVSYREAMGRGAWGGSWEDVDTFVAGLKSLRSWKCFDEGWMVERKVNISLMKCNDEVPSLKSENKNNALVQTLQSSSNTR